MKKDAKMTNYALWVGRVLFMIYLAGLCYFLFFAENYGRVTGLEKYRYNLVPFKEIERFWKYRRELGMYSFHNLAGNILGFVPAGFFIPMLWRDKKGFFFTVCLTFQMSLLAEIVQLIFRVGSFDVDDLLLNTFGGMLGYLLLILLKKWRDHEKI
jgi:glycopeptide antibiotics resistance protein